MYVLEPIVITVRRYAGLLTVENRRKRLNVNRLHDLTVSAVLAAWAGDTRPPRRVTTCTCMAPSCQTRPIRADHSRRRRPFKPLDKRLSREYRSKSGLSVSRGGHRPSQHCMSLSDKGLFSKSSVLISSDIDLYIEAPKPDR